MSNNGYFRVMVEGEDGTVFCYIDHVHVDILMDVVKDAEMAYPCGRVWTEMEMITPY